MSRRVALELSFGKVLLLAAIAAAVLAGPVAFGVLHASPRRSEFAAAAGRGQERITERLAFEVSSVRSHPVVPGGGRGGGGVSITRAGCAATGPQIDPGRFAVANVTLYNLVAWAYGANLGPSMAGNCSEVFDQGLISGGPNWSRSELWDVEGVISPSGPRYSDAQLRRGEAPELQRMLLTLLEDRFGLVLRREMREVPAYALTRSGELKFTLNPILFPTGVDDPQFRQMWDSLPAGDAYAEGPSIIGKGASVADLIPTIQRYSGRPVLDQTGITEPFDFSLLFRDPRPAYTGPNAPGFATRSGTVDLTSSSLPSLADALEDQIGLKLIDATTTIEVWVIESAQRPSEN